MNLWERRVVPSLQRGRAIRLGLLTWRHLVLGLLATGAALGLAEAAAHQAGFAAYGFDFHGGIWRAGQDVLAGRSPYRAPDATLLAALFIPLALLPFWLAVVLLNLACVGALVAALRLLGVRSRQVYLLCLCSAPFVFALRYGDPDAIYVLLAALAWSYRDRPRGAFAVGALIAAKLLLWPMVVWLLATRRFR